MRPSGDRRQGIAALLNEATQTRSTATQAVDGFLYPVVDVSWNDAIMSAIRGMVCGLAGLSIEAE